MLFGPSKNTSSMYTQAEKCNKIADMFMHNHNGKLSMKIFLFGSIK